MSDEIKHYDSASKMHNARFAEPCRDKYLELTEEEYGVKKINQKKFNPLKCEQEIYLGFFFDGTNNNKYRDVKSDSQSNVKNSDF